MLSIFRILAQPVQQHVPPHPHSLNTKILWWCRERRHKEGHSCVAGDMLPVAMHLVPDCIDITVTLGNTRVASKMYSEAEGSSVVCYAPVLVIWQSCVVSQQLYLNTRLSFVTEKGD